ncbi:CotH kinase family protein [Sporosarcina sp. FSL K6-1522]|uniref:CotH kinase family protein n=1 Tax=Sporosarcina sp. FSL K6-1522 TaxID=2921554 RepID=UPI003159FBBF
MDKNQPIPEYQLFIHPADVSELRKDIWYDDPVAAKLTVNKKKYAIGIAYRGSHIRDLRKKSYAVEFYKPSKYQQATAVHWNAEFKDPSLLRNKLSFDFFTDIGCLAPAARFVFLKINGKNEGLYLEIEAVDECFLANRKLPKGAVFYAVDGDANFSLMSDLRKEVKESLALGYEQKCGTEQEHEYLQEFIYIINTVSREDFEAEIAKYVHVDQYLRWLAGVVLMQNFDGFVHNYALYRNGETGLFEVIPWDYDATWGRDVEGEVMEEDYLRIEGFNTLTARLLDVRAFRGRYRELLEELLDSKFTVAYIEPKIQALHASIRPYIEKDPYEKDNLAVFDQEPAFIYAYIEARGNYIREQLHLLDE